MPAQLITIYTRGMQKTISELRTILSAHLIGQRNKLQPKQCFAAKCENLCGSTSETMWIVDY